MEAVPEARRFAFLTDPTFTPAAHLSALQNATRARVSRSRSLQPERPSRSHQ
jgi:hypothetical protein